MREPDGRFKKGASGNPGGRRPEGASFEAAARRILEGRVDREALAAVPGIVRALLPPAPTYHDALAAVLLGGDTTALRELLKRVWPAPRPVELSAAPIRVELEQARYHSLSAEPEVLAEVLGILGALGANGSG